MTDRPDSPRPHELWHYDSQSLSEFLGMCAGQLASGNEQVLAILIELASGGDLEKHQTQANLATIADRLLETLGSNKSEA